MERTKECTHAIVAIHDVMDNLNGKWKISIIASLCYGKLRYSDLLKEVNGISGKMLSRDLKELEMNQLITRTVKSTQPITVEYELTNYGATLRKLIDEMAKWGLEHRRRIMNN